jgi:hypothetical protein
MAYGLKLLTPGNPKTEKGKGAGYWTFILHLAPAKLSGFNVCPMATQGCTMACLNTAGRGGIKAGHGILTHEDVAGGLVNEIQAARIRKTRQFFTERDAFMALLAKDMLRAVKLADKGGYVAVFRLNGTSDIRWESVPITVNGNTYPNVMAAFPNHQFYDYTKIANRKNIPANYHLTFSLADGNDAQASAALANGMNVAGVFRNKDVVARYIASGFMGHTVFCGDDTDLRFLDPRNVVVALYAKGNAKKDASGFVRD